MAANNLRRAMLGFSVGDAFGVPYEFRKRDTYVVSNEMIGFGTYDQVPGTWSDDTSLSLAKINALSTGDTSEELMKQYLSYLRDAAYTPHGEVFDVGLGTKQAIEAYESTGEYGNYLPEDEMNNGNGGVMRAWPLAFFDLPSQKTIEEVVDDVVGMTHGHIRSKLVARFYIYLLRLMPGMGERFETALAMAINKMNATVEASLLAEQDLSFLATGEGQSAVDLIARMKEILREDVPSTGYAVDTLKAILWVLLHVESYEDAIELSAGLGNDTDTIAALVGAIAVFQFGRIPAEWVDQLESKNVINLELQYAALSGKFS
jgi:ADP-ribosylglycohydrolase